jgi:hypothetical protein
MRFFQQYRIAKILHTANANKIKGIPAMQIFLLAVSIVFQHKSLYMQMNLHPDTLPFGKDTFYRFFHEFLPYELAQVHYTAEFQYHPALYWVIEKTQCTYLSSMTLSLAGLVRKKSSCWRRYSTMLMVFTPLAFVCSLSDGQMAIPSCQSTIAFCLR